MQEPLWWASNPEWLRELDDRHDLELSNPVPMFEGTLIVLRSDRDEITLTAHRRVTATSRPRDERLAHRRPGVVSPSPIDATNLITATTTFRAPSRTGQIPEHSDPVCETDRQSG